MGRPRKNPEENTSPEGTASDTGSEAPPIIVEAELPKLKACPACGGKAEVKLDIHGLYRCYCQTCGFWDCGAHESPLSAAESWNAAGGPNPVDD